MKANDCKIIILLLFVSACAPQVVQPGTSAPTVMEATTTPTSTPSPEPTLTDAPTPVVSFEGPRLVYQANDSLAIYMMNLDGTGKKRLVLPTGFEIRSLAKAVSPDGKWIAFQSGSTKNKDLALELFSIGTDESILVTPLLSTDYPDNFEKALARIQTSPTDFSGKAEITRANLESSFDLTQVSWSPDSRFLAFAGEMDGPTSDLYIYDTESKTIKRMSDDLLNIGYLEWADDGKIIYFSNIIPGEIYSSFVHYFLNVDNGHVQKSDQAGWGPTDFCFESKFCLWHQQGDGGDPSNISYLNVASGKSRTLWKPSFQDYAIAPLHKLIVVSGPYGDELPPGTYFVDFAGKRKKISDLFFGKLIDWEAEEPGFIGTGPDGIYRISLDGTVQKIAAGDYYEYSISPDGKWLVAYNHNAPDVKSKGLLLLNNKLEVVQNLGDQKIKNLVWRPDSSGLFFTTKDLYHVSIPDGKLRLVENDTNVSLGESDYRWIP